MKELTKEEIQDQIIVECRSFGIDWAMGLAIAEVESDFNPWAVRFEPNWKYPYQVDKMARSMNPVITSATEGVLQATSWGVMQLMGTVARELGYRDHLTRLVDPALNISLGLRHLARLKRTGYTVDDWIASYNAGSPKKFPNGIYANQAYVDKVGRAWERWKSRSKAVVG